MTRRRKILVADLFCGAGGSSTGARNALRDLGLEMELVVLNHWPVAIETHTRNHPEARHYCQDIATVRPHLVVPEGYLDLLMASPTCTHHSTARGGKPTSDQQRSDPWHVVTWFTELRVKRAIIENVPEFVSWGPVDPRTQRPIKARKGEYFRAWKAAIESLGGTFEWRILNCADYGDATTRRRFFAMIRFDKRQIYWPVPTHHKRSDGELALHPGLKPWRAAREIIDWSIAGRSIFTRKKPLSPKTLARIYAGARKFNWPEPFLVILRNHMAAQSVDAPVPTVAANGNHIALAEPVLVNAPTQTAHAAHLFVAEPLILSNQNGPAPRSVEDPAPTITTGGAGSERPGCARPMLVEPLIMNGRRNNQAKPAAEAPLPALDTKGGVWLAEAFVVSAAHGNDPAERDPHSRRTKSADEPIGTIHAGGGNFAVVAPFVLSRQGEGAPRSVDEPTPTQVAKHSHALIAPYYGSGSGETCKDTAQPLDTVPTKGRFGLVVPVTQSGGGPGPRDIEQPIPTLTTAKGGEFAMVVPVTHAGGEDRVQDTGAPLPTVTGANRGELAFITGAFGEREGQAPRVHDVAEPAPTVCAKGRINLVEPIMIANRNNNAAKDPDRDPTPALTTAAGGGIAVVEPIAGLPGNPDGYDILFRMLEPHELAAAMGFSGDDQTYEFAGTKTQKIKQIGNAVPVGTATALVKAAMADAAPKGRKIAPAAPVTVMRKAAE